MESREIICIACPMGCHLLVQRDSEGQVKVTGNTCKRGETYGVQEFTCPMRTVTSSVRVSRGTHPLCSVKTQNVVPKARIPEVLAARRTANITAPAHLGDVVIADIAGTGVNLVATSDCPAR